MNRVYIYNANDPSELSIQIEEIRDLGLARRVCVVMDWNIAKHWREAHPFHGLFWSDCTLYLDSEIKHKASNTVAKLLEIKAKNGMLSRFQNRNDLYEPLFNSLNFPNHTHFLKILKS